MNDLHLAVTISLLATFYVTGVYGLMKYLSILQNQHQANQAD
jgi:hypothetical protein